MKSKKVNPVKYYNDQRDLKKAQMGKAIKSFFKDLKSDKKSKKPRSRNVPDTSRPQALKRNKCTSGSKRGCRGGLRSYQF